MKYNDSDGPTGSIRVQGDLLIRREEARARFAKCLGSYGCYKLPKVTQYLCLAESGRGGAVLSHNATSFSSANGFHVSRS